MGVQIGAVRAARYASYRSYGGAPSPEGVLEAQEGEEVEVAPSYEERGAQRRLRRAYNRRSRRATRQATLYPVV